MALNEIFIIGSRKKNNNTNNNNYNSNGYNLRNYVKKGTIEENAIDELYKKTTLKLGDDYRNRLSTLLYRENHVKDYFNKRINLDKNDQFETVFINEQITLSSLSCAQYHSESFFL